jgi:hypothetical protein
MRTVSDNTYDPSRTMMQCLRMSTVASASDPRDSIFGVLSLLEPKRRKFLPVDYSMNYNQILGLAVMLCIAECSDLDILMYANLDENAQTDSNHTESCTFGIDEFRKFLHDSEGSETLGPTAPSSYNFVSVKMISQSSRRLEIVDALRSDSSSVVEHVPGLYPPQQILPRLKVRAHLIDISCGGLFDDGRLWLQMTTSSAAVSAHFTVADRDWLRWLFLVPRDTRTPDSRNKQDYNTTMRDAMRHRLKRVFLFFQDSTVKDLEDRPSHRRNAREMESRFDYDDFELCRTELRIRPKDSTLFRTHYSIGCTTRHQIPGDHIFFIDGAIPPFVLRPVGPGIYRIVGYCYIWKARELDYWDRGTFKGLWLDRPFDLGEGTRMIEIY